MDVGYLRPYVMSVPQDLMAAVEHADEDFGSILRACRY
jgi:hypothetical protein